MIAHTPTNECMLKPVWMELFNLYIECEEIERRFQAQPTCKSEWDLLMWANITLESLPDSKDETTWDLAAPIPPNFAAWSSNRELHNVNLFLFKRLYIYNSFFSDKHFNNFEVFIFSDGL